MVINNETVVPLKIVTAKLLKSQSDKVQAEVRYLFYACKRNDLDVAWYVINKL